MFGRKRAPRAAGDAGLQDRAWSMVESGELLVRRNHALATLPDRAAYADFLLVQVPLRAPGAGDDPLVPGDFARLDALEDALVAELGAGDESVLALVITREGRRRFVFYTRDRAAAERKAASVTAQLGEEADHGGSPDPEWGFYQRFMALR